MIEYPLVSEMYSVFSDRFVAYDKHARHHEHSTATHRLHHLLPEDILQLLVPNLSLKYVILILFFQFLLI